MRHLVLALMLSACGDSTTVNRQVRAASCEVIQGDNQVIVDCTDGTHVAVDLIQQESEVVCPVLEENDSGGRIVINVNADSHGGSSQGGSSTGGSSSSESEGGKGTSRSDSDTGNSSASSHPDVDVDVD